MRFARHGAKRTQADYHSFYQIPSVVLAPFLKKNVWPGRNVRSRISRERSEVIAWHGYVHHPKEIRSQELGVRSQAEGRKSKLAYSCFKAGMCPGINRSVTDAPIKDSSPPADLCRTAKGGRRKESGSVPCVPVAGNKPTKLLKTQARYPKTDRTIPIRGWTIEGLRGWTHFEALKLMTDRLLAGSREKERLSPLWGLGTQERRQASHLYAIMAILILIVSTALFIFYLYATCRRILRREFGHK
jgi:hypothetical protein